jgi:hypothetical protein
MNEAQLLFLPKVSDIFKELTVLISEAYTDFANTTSNVVSNVSATSNNSIRHINKYFKRKMLLPIIVLVILVVLVITIYGNIANKNTINSTNTVLSNTDQRIELVKPKTTRLINRQFLFSLKDSTGLEVSKIKFYIENVQLQDQIVIKGQKATAVAGRTFLIINLKITNDYNKPVTINSRDYIRLMVNNNKEWLAPDIHNDPVDIQAISTKYTRLGLPIDDVDRNFYLQVGEIAGKKEVIALTL